MLRLLVLWPLLRCAVLYVAHFSDFLLACYLFFTAIYEILIARFTRYSMGLMAPPLVLFVRLPLAPVAPRRRLGGWVWSD